MNEKSVTFLFNGDEIVARSDQSLAAAILESGQRVLRETRTNQNPRGIFCGIGVCFDCLVVDAACAGAEGWEE